MIDKFFDLIERHKMAFVVVASIIAFILMQALMSCSSGTAAKAPEKETAASEAESSRSEATKEAVKLSDEQKHLIGSYDEPTKVLQDQLVSGKWTGIDGKGSIEFKKDGTFKETVPGSDGEAKVSKGTYAISASTALGNGGDSFIIAFLTDDDKTIIATLQSTTGTAQQAQTQQAQPAAGPSASQAPVLTLACDGFENQAGYTTEYAYRGLSFEGLDDKRVSDAVGGKTADLEKAVTDYLAVNISSAYRCSWDQTASYDYSLGTSTLGMLVTDCITGTDGKEQTHYLTVTYKAADGTFAVADGGAAAQQQQNQEG